jgi:hypothetical protein
MQYRLSIFFSNRIGLLLAKGFTNIPKTLLTAAKEVEKKEQLIVSVEDGESRPQTAAQGLCVCPVSKQRVHHPVTHGVAVRSQA